MSDGGLLQQSLVYLAAAVVSVPIARKLGLGSVLGYLIAGILIGPFALELVGRDQADVLHFAEFGVVMMLFLVGLELRPTLLWRMRLSILGLGGLQVVVTALAVFAVAQFAGLDLRESIAIGMVFALSSTAIVLQSLAERGWLKTSGGQGSFSVLLFQDIAVIPMLALLPLLAGHAEPLAAHDAHGAATLTGWQQGLMLLGVVAAMIVGGRFLARPAFRFIAEAKLPEIFTAAALMLVIMLAWVMQLVGVSPALGAFVGGVVLADSEFRHQLESDIEPFKGLLLGLFFITVGATMDLGLLAQNWTLIVLLVVALMAGKFLILLLLGRLFRMELTQNLLLATALCQGGEFGFVLFGSARQFGVLEPALVDLLILVVAVSMAMTPLAMIAYARAMLGVSRKRSGRQEEETMEAQDNPVIIAGYGRFGQVVGRLLHGNGIGVTLLDDDASHIERVRRFGYKVYFGDAARMDLLHTAGADDAELLVLAIDDRDKILRIVDDVRREFPHLKILARASDRSHAYQLMARGVEVIRRETFSSALETGTEALKLLGYRAFQARRLAQLFRCNDEQTLEALYKVWSEDEEKYVLESRRRRDDLTRLLQADKQGNEEMDDHAWERSTDS